MDNKKEEDRSEYSSTTSAGAEPVYQAQGDSENHGAPQPTAADPVHQEQRDGEEQNRNNFPNGYSVNNTLNSQDDIDNSIKENVRKSDTWNFSQFKSYRHLYLAVIFILSSISICIYCCLANSYKEDADKIVELQKKDSQTIETLLITSGKVDNSNKTDIQDVFDKHEERIESIMNLEYSKLESDFNFISIWAAALTIVFLVFSIYSIFKTDEMLRQAEEESKHIHEFYGAAKTESQQIVLMNKSSYDSVKKNIKELFDNAKQDIEQIKSVITKINMDNEELLKGKKGEK